MALPIRTFPDPVLTQPARAVPQIDREVSRLIDALIATMRHHPRCVGLAAPQVGSPLRVAVMDSSANPKAGKSQGLLVLVNPRLSPLEESSVRREGCLSLPDLTANVRRATRVRLAAQDESGAAYQLELQGFESIVAQHEVDHLDGKLFLDRVSDVRADVFKRKQYW
jgi:peptide deformylase